MSYWCSHLLSNRSEHTKRFREKQNIKAMNTKILFALVLCLCAQVAIGQKYFSKSGKISFFSDTDMEKIEAENTSASTVIDFSTGAIEWAVLIQGFQFEKALMQEHFNENYMESSKYPKAKFKGVIEDHAKVDLAKDGTYEVTVNGELEIRGIKKPVSTKATIEVANKMFTGTCSFSVLIADYGIKVPKVVENNIADAVDIDIMAEYKPL